MADRAVVTIDGVMKSKATVEVLAMGSGHNVVVTELSTSTRKRGSKCVSTVFFLSY